jgi:hypothetical protein
LREAASVNWSDLTMPKREAMIRQVEAGNGIPSGNRWKYSNFGLTLAGRL